MTKLKLALGLVAITGLTIANLSVNAYTPKESESFKIPCAFTYDPGTTAIRDCIGCVLVNASNYQYQGQCP